MKVSPEIMKMEPYRPGKPISETQREYGIERVYKLASNENSLGVSPKALEAMEKALPELFRYPDPTCYELLHKLSQQWNIPANQMVAGNGSDELIELLVRIYCEPHEGILTSQGAFAAYQVSAHASRVIPHFVPMRGDYGFDLESMADFFLSNPQHKIHLIFIANPNNPTGTLATHTEIESFLKKVGNRDDVFIVFDEAYTEFVRHPDYRDAFYYFRNYNNVILLRTFSKVYGLAGIRLGVMVAPTAVIEVVNRVRKPFNVNHLAQVAVVAALDDKEFLKNSQDLVWQGLDFFYQELNRLGLPYIPSQGNFVLFDTLREAQLVYQALLRKGIILRPVGNYGFPRHLRLSVGTKEENLATLQALTEVLAELATPSLPLKLNIDKAKVITIDGPAASGKTSVSRELAARLGWKWVSTGSFYRGLAYVALQKGLDIYDTVELVKVAHSRDWQVELTPQKTKVMYLGVDVTQEIGEEKVGSIASKISQFPEVRQALLDMQRKCSSPEEGLIAEGRDCGTVVFPEALAKIYLTATSEDRAARRAADQGLDVEKTAAMQEKRDRQDSQRKVAPLQRPNNALLIDASQYNLLEVVEKVESYVRPLIG